MKIKLDYALHKNKLVHITEVVKGLNCNCYCPNPNCNSQLVARKGAIKKHHFAHYKMEECIGAYESLLHLMAKDILKIRKEIVLPALEFHDDLFTNKIVSLTKNKRVKAQSVKLEVSQGDFQPDVVMEFDKKQLFIEIAVTHFIDQEKFHKILNKNISLLEIDLSDFKNGFEKEALVEAVINSTDNKYWIHNSLENLLIRDYLKKKNKELEDEKEYSKKIKENKRYNSRLKGYRIIKTNNNYKICCPKVIKEGANKFQSNEIIERLRKGNRWNGIIYGRTGQARYVFIDKDKYEIFPSDKNNNLSAIESAQKKQIYGQLSRLRIQANLDCEECEKCIYFNEYIEAQEELSCKFKR